MKLTEDIKPVTSMRMLLQLIVQGEMEVQAGRTVPQAEAIALVRKWLSQREREG